MFTGLVESVGKITEIVHLSDGVRLSVYAPDVLGDAKQGDSICVNGVCLTVLDASNEVFIADVMRETLEVTSLGTAEPGRSVNLERAIRPDTRLGGHIVQGHVEETGTVLEVHPGEQQCVLRIKMSRETAPLVVNKGSITVDGVALTVSEISPAIEAVQWFEVSLIPETLKTTNLGDLETGDTVNLETDIIARHLQRLGEFNAETALDAVK